MIWLKKISRVFHVSKCRGKSLETFYDEICLLIVFFGPVILIANCHSFQMRYWGGLCDFRKNYKSHFSGDTCLKYIVNDDVRPRILASIGQNELGKKS